jgi:hypothetical protein
MRIQGIPLEITPEGEIFFDGKKCSTRRATRGYQQVQLSLHRLVAHAFHGPPPSSKHVCHHKDGNPRNNRADNLCWVTQAENCRFHFSGKPRKLTERQVDEILAKKPSQLIALSDLAESFGVSYSAVRAIRSGVNWKRGSAGSNRTILTAGQVKQVRDWAPPTITAAMLARRYHVSAATILAIWHGRY